MSLVLVQSSADYNTCSHKPTLVSKPYLRSDLFNRRMSDVLLTSVLVTTNGNHTLGHFGTSDGRILQVTTHLKPEQKTVTVMCYWVCLYQEISLLFCSLLFLMISVYKDVQTFNTHVT